MLMLRYAYVLALAVWLGGMVVLGAIVAPSVFQVLPAYAPVAGRALAGAVFGTVLQRFHYVAYASGGVLLVTLVGMALLGPRPRSFAIRAAIIAVMLGVALYSGVVVLGEIDTLQRELAATSPGNLCGRHARRGSSLAAARRRCKAGPLRSAPSALDQVDDDQYRWHAIAALLGGA